MLPIKTKLKCKKLGKPRRPRVSESVFYQLCHLSQVIPVMSLAIPGLSLLVPSQSQDVPGMSYSPLSILICPLFVFFFFNPSANKFFTCLWFILPHVLSATVTLKKSKNATTTKIQKDQKSQKIQIFFLKSKKKL